MTRESERAVFFFGDKLITRDSLPERFPQYQLCWIKQTHGVQVVAADVARVMEADGHFTAQPNQALIIQTADCAPILLASDAQVCALHAGWRGVAGHIVGKAKKWFRAQPNVACIGPHIQVASFEIHREVATQLTAAAPKGADASRLLRAHPDPAKCYFDLRALLTLQLQEAFPNIQISASDEDTFVNPAFHSFRRDGQAAGRQFSFVVLKP